MHLLATSILKDLSASVCDVCSLQRPGKSLNIFILSLSLFFLMFQTEVSHNHQHAGTYYSRRHSESKPFHFKFCTYEWMGFNKKLLLFIFNAALFVFMK